MRNQQGHPVQYKYRDHTQIITDVRDDAGESTGRVVAKALSKSVIGTCARQRHIGACVRIEPLGGATYTLSYNMTQAYVVPSQTLNHIPIRRQLRHISRGSVREKDVQ